jgi:hypothetical protein
VFDARISERKNLNPHSSLKMKYQLKRKLLGRVKSEDMFRKAQQEEPIEGDGGTVEDCDDGALEEHYSSRKHTQRGETKRSAHIATSPKLTAPTHKNTPNKPSKPKRALMDSEELLSKNIEIEAELAKLVRNIKKEQRK